jgi:hypothetical protein
VVFSTQCFCRIAAGSVLFEGSLWGEWNECIVTCSNDRVLDHGISGVPVCRTSSVTLTNRSSLDGSIHLPNVTMLDRLLVRDSFIRVTNSTDFPTLQPLSESTLEQLEEYLINQEFWVRQWLLQL